MTQSWPWDSQVTVKTKNKKTCKCQEVQTIAKNKLKNKLKVFKELNIVKSLLVTKSELKKVILSRKIDSVLLRPQIDNLLKQNVKQYNISNILS